MKKLILALLLLMWSVPGWAAEVAISTGYKVSVDEGGKTSALVAPKNSKGELIAKRTATSKHYDMGNGVVQTHCWNKDAPAHYKDDYGKDVDWKEIDPTYYEDKGTYLEFSRMPQTVKVWKGKYGYEITDRRTNEKMSAELLEVDDTALELASSKLLNVDFEVVVQPNGVRFWKHIKTDGPKKFKWKIEKSGDKTKLAFRDVPEAKDLEDKEVVVQTSKQEFEGGFYWTEQVDKTGISIDTDFEGQTSDGYIEGFHAVYSTARSTSTSIHIDDGQLYVGQYSDSGYYVERTFLDFDTSAIDDSYIVIQVNLRMGCRYNDSDTDFDVQIVKQTWTEPIAAGNQEANYDGCLAGTADDNIWRNTSGIALAEQYTSGNLSTAWVNKTGDTKYSLRSSRDVSATTPTGSEGIGVYSSAFAEPDLRPCLIVTSEAPPAGWTGKVIGVTNPGKIIGVADDNIGKVLGVE